MMEVGRKVEQRLRKVGRALQRAEEGVKNFQLFISLRRL